MKKLKYLLFVLFLIPCVVKADMAGPSLKPYKMVVTNPDGIDYYEDTDFKEVAGHLDKDKQFTVNYEYDDEYTIDIGKDDLYYVSSLDGAMLVKDSVDPTKDKDDMIHKLKKQEEVIVYNEDGVDILEGPADIYKKVGYAPKGAKLKYEYYISEEDSPKTYIYTEYKNKKGWVNVLNKNILFPFEQDFIAMNDFKIKGTTIPKNTVVRSYYTFDGWSRSALIKYNDCEDEVSTYDEISTLLDVSRYYAKSNTEFKVYSEANDKGTLVTTIPNKTKFTVIATYYKERGAEISQEYVEYNGKRGWIVVKHNYEENAKDEYEYLEEEITDSSIIPNNEEKTTKKEEATKSEEPTGDVAPVPDKKEKKTSKKKPEDYTLTYVIIGASVAVVALVTIILVNKKSKKKKAVVKEENVVEQPIVKEEPVVEKPNMEETQVINDIQKTEIEDTTEKTE